MGVGLLPGTAPEAVAQKLADAVIHLPVPAAALIGSYPMPEDISGRARALGERQGLAAAAEDYGMLFARLWFQPAQALPADAATVAIALVRVWDEHVHGVESGLTSTTCMPAFSQERWFRGAGACRSLARTTAAPAGLIPESD